MTWDCVAWYHCNWSHGWRIGLIANTVLVIAYAAIALKIFTRIHHTGQRGENPLAQATGALFLTCGVGHGIMAGHLALPTLAPEMSSGLALRSAFNEWHMWMWPPLTASAGVFYWTLRSRFSTLIRGASLFEDLEQRRHQAMDIHDNVVQSVASAKMALEQGDSEAAKEDIEEALAQSQLIITDLMDPPEGGPDIRPGDLRRERAAGDAR